MLQLVFCLVLWVWTTLSAPGRTLTTAGNPLTPLAQIRGDGVYLNPATGRFWTMDSFEGNSSDPLSLHKYLYTHADPVNGIDPSGHETSLIGQLGTQAAILTVATLTANAVTTAMVSQSLSAHLLKKGAFPDQFYMSVGFSGAARGGYGGASATIMWDAKTGKAYYLGSAEVGISPISLFKGHRGFGAMLSLGFTFNANDVSDFSQWGYQAAWPVAMANTILPTQFRRYFNWLTTLAARIGTASNPSTQLTKSSGAVVLGRSTSGAAYLGYAMRQNAFAFGVSYTGDPVEVPLADLPDWATGALNDARSFLTGSGN